MLSALLNTPSTDQQWQIWSWHHRLSHDEIRQALFKRGVSVVDYAIEPINPSDPSGFLQRNSQLHLEMNNALSLGSQDLQDVNLGNEDQKVSWIMVHWREHQDAEVTLGIGS